MKVRCINGSWTNNELTTGKEYEVLSEVGCYYQLKINDKGIRYHCYEKSRFEVIKEDNKMQEKTFREVITDIKEGEVWESRSKYIKRFNDGIQIYHKENGKATPSMLMADNDKFKLQRKEYTFEEAFKAYEEGKEIESCYSQYKYKKEGGLDLYSKTENEWYVEDRFEIDEIRGKWYINN